MLKNIVSIFIAIFSVLIMSSCTNKNNKYNPDIHVINPDTTIIDMVIENPT